MNLYHLRYLGFLSSSLKQLVDRISQGTVRTGVLSRRDLYRAGISIAFPIQSLDLFGHLICSLA